VIWLNRINLLNGNDFNIEERKRAIQRREASDAYKKNTTYTQKTNPLLQALEQLLSGNKEKELNDEHLLSLIEEELNDFNTVSTDNMDSHDEQSNLEVNDVIVQNDLNAYNEIQQTRSQITSTNEDSDSFEIDRFNFRTFDTFALRGKSSDRYGRNLEIIPFDKTYNIAITKYNHHMLMVKNGYTFNQPKYSLTA